MANMFSTATLGLRVDTKQFGKNMDGVYRATTQALEGMKLSADAFNAKWRDMTDGIKETKRIISGILISQGFYTLMNGLSMGATAALQFSMNMETAAVSMEYFVDGTDKAAKSLAFLREMNTFAAETPFSTEDALSMSKYMQAVGIGMNSTKSVLQVITDAAAATGATQENLQRIVFALGQMQTKGRIANEEIRQLANANIPVYEILQEELNLTGEEISNIGNYWIDADKAIVAILRGLEKRYDGASERISNTVSGMTDTIIDDLKIIAQQAGTGVYGALSAQMTDIRDALDRYRQIATEQGSMGLFNQILVDLDSAGEIGTRILALIGNARQLGTQLVTLYNSGKPLIELFGTSMYASLNVATITLSSFLQIANAAVKVLNELGITSGTAGQLIASLYIAYKAASWMGTMGQAAAAAGYQLYTLGNAAFSVLPASLQAHKGVTLLSAGLAGLAAYALTAIGIFSMLNNAFAGLDSSKTGGNIFPDDYSQALKEYQQQMAEYNEAIKQYQDDFNAPYTTVDDGVDKATDALEKLEDENAAAAKSIKDTWLASFDEVYSPPEQSDSGSGGAGAGGIEWPDFGAGLTLPEIKFPTIDQAMPEMPEFPWNDVYGDGLLDADVLDGAWWAGLLPAVIAGGALQLGKIIAKNRAATTKDIKKGADSVTSAIEMSADDLRKAYKEATRTYAVMEDDMRRLLDELANPKNSAELNALLSRNLDRLVASGEKTVKRLNEVEDALKLTGAARTDTSVFNRGLQQAQYNKLVSNVEEIVTLQQRLTNTAVASSAEGTAIRAEIKALRDDTVKGYLKYAGAYGSEAVLESLAETAGLSLPSLTNDVDAVQRNIRSLLDMADTGFTDLSEAKKLISATNKLLDNISANTAAADITSKSLGELRGELGVINKLVQAGQTAELNKNMHKVLSSVLDNTLALSELGTLTELEADTLGKLSDGMRKAVGNSTLMQDALTKVVRLFDATKREVLTARQAQLTYNKAFVASWAELTNRQLPRTFALLQTVQTYGSRALKSTAQGNDILRKLSKSLDTALNAQNIDATGIKPTLKALQEDVQKIVSGNASGRGLSETYLPRIAAAIESSGKQFGAETAIINERISELSAGILREQQNIRVDKLLDYIKGITAQARPIKVAKDPLAQSIYKLADKYAALPKSVDTAVTEFYTAVEKLYAQQAAKDGVQPQLYSSKYNELISDSVDYIEAEHARLVSDAGAMRRGISIDAFNQAISGIGSDIRNIPEAQADAIGKGIRSTAYDLLNDLEASRQSDYQDFVRTLRAGGIFDINKSLATGGDLGALYLGQTSFGNTAMSKVIDNLLTDSPLADLLRQPVGSARNMVSRFIGTEAESLALRLLAKELESNGKMLYKAGNYVDQTRRVLVQLDGTIGTLNEAQVPVDTKVLANSSYTKLRELTETLGTVNGRNISIAADSFDRLLRAVPDYALQIAAQATVLGTNTANLAIFNHELAGLTKTLGSVDDINVATRTGQGALKSLIREAIAQGISDESALDAFADSLRIISVEIPDEATKLVYSLADGLRTTEIKLSEIAAQGASVEDMLKYFTNRLSSGEDIGQSGLLRYVGKNFTWQDNTIKQVTEYINSTVEPLLKSSRASAVALGVQRLEAIEAALQTAISTAKETAFSDELLLKLPSASFGSGTVQEVKVVAEDAVSVLRSIREYQKVMTGYQFAAITQLNDMVQQLEAARAAGKELTDIVGTRLKGTERIPKYLSDLVQETATAAKTVEKMYGVADELLSRQLREMLEQGRISTINNPFKVADILELPNVLDDISNGADATQAAVKVLPDAITEKLEGIVAHTDDVAAEVIAGLKSAKLSQERLPGAIKDAVEAASKAAPEVDKGAARAADAATEAASEATEAAKAATRAASFAAELADTDTLFKAFSEVLFDAAAQYTIKSEKDGVEIITKLAGERLIRAQEAGRTGFTTATILDAAGNVVYRPIVEIGKELTRLVEFMDFAGSADAARLFGLTGDARSLSTGVELLHETLAIMRRQALQGEDVGVSIQKLTKAMNELEPLLYTRAGYAGIDTAHDAGKVFDNIYTSFGDTFIKKLSDAIGDIDADTLSKLTAKVNDVVANSLGVSGDIIEQQLRSSAAVLGKKTAAKYADEIAEAASSTVETLGKQIANAPLPEIKFSETLDEVMEAASVRMAKEISTASTKSFDFSKILFGGTAGVGLLDVLGIGLEGVLASQEVSAMQQNVDTSLRYDESLTEAIAKLDAAGVSLADLAKEDSGFIGTLKSVFGAGDLSNAAYESVGVEIGTTGAGALAGLGASALGLAALPAALVAAATSIIPSLFYSFTGGDTIGNQYGPKLLEAIQNDTFYKNAKEAGLSDEEARAVADAAENKYANIVLPDIDDSLWKRDDLEQYLYGKGQGNIFMSGSYDLAAEKLKGSSEYAVNNRLIRLAQALGDAGKTIEGIKIPEITKEIAKAQAEYGYYQTGDLEGMVEVLDFIFKGGNYDSDIAKEFFANYGEKELAYLRTTEYGDYMEAYDNAEKFVEMLNELGILSDGLATIIENGQLGSIIQAAVNFKNDADASIENLLDVFKTAGSASGIEGSFVRKEAAWVSSDDDLSDDQAAEAILNAFSGLDEDISRQLREEYGLAISTQVKEFTNSAGQVINELYSAVQIDQDKLADKAVGWTIDVPDTFSLSSATLSANDIEVLAQAGIQINSDGTISFMKALNENITGTEREASLSLDELASKLLGDLSAGGINVTAGLDASKLSFDVEKLASDMHSAMFKTSITQVSDNAAEAISSLGRVLESGYIEITNDAVLNGEMTVEQYLDSMGTAISTLSPELQEELLRIDDVIAQGGDATAASIAAWADGITIPSIIDAGDLTPEIIAAFKEVGVSFEYAGDQLMMTINHLGNDIKDGMTLIPEETWDTLSESVKAGLKQLGVTWTTEAGYVKVDISNTLGSMFTSSDISEDVANLFDELGITLKTSGNKIVGILDSNSQLIADNMVAIPDAIRNTMLPETKAALDELGITLVETTEGAFLDLSSIVSNGVGTLVATFVEQPDLWNQLPEVVKQAYVAAGIATEDGLLKINASTISGLQPINGTWVGFWQNMPTTVRDTLSEAGLVTNEGLFQIRQYIDESSIPEGVDYIKASFNELPPEIQQAIQASGEAINENGYIIYNASADMIQNMEEAIIDGKDGAVSAAEDMARQVGDAVAKALQDMQQLQSLRDSAGSSGGWFGSGLFGSKNGVAIYGYGKDGTTYYVETNAAGKPVAYYYYDSYGRKKKLYSAPNINSRATGGTTEGLTLAGELGRELAILPDGSTLLLGAHGRGELVDLPGGTQILSNPDTEKVLRYAGGIDAVASYATGTSGADNALETLQSMRMSSTQPVDVSSLHNAGIRHTAVTQQVVQQQADVPGIVQQVLEFVLPAMTNSQAEQKPPLYVGTLIADDRGLRKLKNKLDMIER